MTTAGAVGIGSCGGGNIGNGICELAGHCCSQYGWCGTEPEYCSDVAPTAMEPVTAALVTATAPLETVPATATSATAGTRDEEWLDSHNSRRRQWHEDNGKGYVPLQWSSALKADAQVWAQYLLDTNQFEHDPTKGPYGENIAMNSGSVIQPTTENVLSRWVEDEADDDYPENGHLTQVLWRATKWVGCADARSGDRHVQVCRYARPGNCNMNDYDTWLEPMLADWSPC